MEAVDTRAVRGIRAYLERRGFEILEEGWAHGGDVADFIARDEDDLVRFDVVNLLVVGEGRTLLRYHPGAEAPGGGAGHNDFLTTWKNPLPWTIYWLFGVWQLLHIHRRR